jgi:hypothetical protein
MRQKRVSYGKDFESKVITEEMERLEDGDIIAGDDGVIYYDTIDPDYSYGTTAIGFEYRSKLTGDVVILHPSQLKYLTYRKPTKKE